MTPTGIINAGNAFPSTDSAPALLKLYVDPDNDLSTPDTFTPGQYILSINENLKSFVNGPFCTNGGGVQLRQPAAAGPALRGGR